MLKKSEIYPVLASTRVSSCLVIPWQGMRELGVGFIAADEPERLLQWSELDYHVNQPTDLMALAFANLKRDKASCHFQPVDRGVWWLTPSGISTCPSRALSALLFQRELYGWAAKSLGVDISGMYVAAPRNDVLLFSTNIQRLQLWTSRFYDSDVPGTLSPIPVQVREAHEQAGQIQLHEHHDLVPSRQTRASISMH